VPKAGFEDGRTHILRMLAIALVLVVAMVLAARVTCVKDRWLQCLLTTLPLGLFILLEDRLTPRRQWLLIILSSAMSLGAMVGFMIARLQPDLHGDPPSATVPFDSIAEQIRAHGFKEGYIIADRSYIPGNLKLYFSESTVAEPEYGLWPVPHAGKTAPVLLVWEVPKEGSPPPTVGRLLKAFCGSTASREVKSCPASGLYEHSDTCVLGLTRPWFPPARRGWANRHNAPILAVNQANMTP